VGFGIWASKVTTLSFSKRQWFVVLAEANRLSQAQVGRALLRLPYRTSCRSILPTPPRLSSIVMCGIMVFAGAIALFGLQRGRQEIGPPDTVESVPASTSIE
jgi:hypothetical protein